MEVDVKQRWSNEMLICQGKGADTRLNWVK